MPVDAALMASMRAQAIALAHTWFVSGRECLADEDGYAFFYVRARDLGLSDHALPQMRIKVEMTMELEP